MLKLSQLFIGKKVKITGNTQVYTCKDIRKTESGIEMLCTGENGQSQTFNFKNISLTCRPFTISYFSPDYRSINLGRVFYYAYEPDKCYLVSDQQNMPAYIKNYYIRKFGSVYGMSVMNKKIELGMTVEMVQEVYGQGEITRHVASGCEIIVLTYGGYNEFSRTFNKIRTYTFVNNRLTEYSE